MSIISKSKLQSLVAMQWSIPENRLLELKDKPGEFLSSESFKVSNISGVEYYLSIYPNDDDHHGATGIYLCLHNSDEIKVEANFSLTIDSANYAYEEEKYVFNESSGWGGLCCKAGELYDSEKRFIYDGKLTIKMDGIFTIENDIPEKAETFVNHPDALCLELWNQEEDKNFTITADGKEITEK
uniref:MATH domain-containing protein n=1 Tax=Panagrolaimus sp. ES5 TaxID=591445 RepID=A0AC34FPN9_9BILA